jgi:hypothetical protein
LPAILIAGVIAGLLQSLKRYTMLGMARRSQGCLSLGERGHDDMAKDKEGDHGRAHVVG